MTVKHCLIYLFLLLLPIPVTAQAHLTYVETVAAIDQKFELLVNDYLYAKILGITGEKMEIHADQIRFNSQPLQVKSCKIRGNTTLLFRRKSFSLSLKEPVDFQGESVKRLAINNLAMDKNYWRARLCFLLMERIGIFPLKNQFTELVLNQETQGIYLMIQKPEDYCRELGSNLLVRREGSQKMTVEYAQDAEAKKAVKQLKKFRELPKQYAGRQLYDTLNLVVDFDSYSKWLAFNYLIMNGDYMDELFLFLDPETNKFRTIPWDYDDVFAPQPHEGQFKRDHAFGNQLLFSSEAAFDIVIARDEYLYKKYLESFGEILTHLTPEALTNTFEQVYRELAPFFSDPEIIAQSQYDQSGLTSIELLKEDLEKHHHFLLNRRNSIETELMINN